MWAGGKHFDCTGLMVNTDGDLDLTELTFIKNDKKKKNFPCLYTVSGFHGGP